MAIMQTVETHDEAITEIIVDMDTNGNLERNLTIESMYDIDAMSSNVYALIGEPFNFETPTSFNSAKITFKVDKTKLGDTKFDNLLILWYNEEEQIFEEMETFHDEANSTVSTTTTHFSQYMIVDSEKWFANWETSFNELRKMWDGGTSYYKSMNTIFIIDCSEGVDPENNRLAICQNILNNMKQNDQAAAITYSYGVRYSIGFHDPQAISECLERNIDNVGPSKALVAAFNSAMYMVYNSPADINRIVILTNRSSSFTGELYKYNFNNVIVNAVNLGDIEFGDAIKDVTYLTGGNIYNIATADELTYQYGDEVYIPPQFIGEDSDGDGIPNLVEECGLLPNGQRLGTSSLLKDSDGDGIPDNEEFNISMDKLTYEINKEQYVNAIYAKSHPNEADTDGDFDLDSIDPHPHSYQLNDCMINNIIKVENLARDYISNGNSVSGSYETNPYIWLVFMFIRQFNKDYVNENWDGTGNAIDKIFVSYVLNNDLSLYNYFANTSNYYVNANGDVGDLYHLAATITGYIYKSDCSFELKFGVMPEYHINNLSGWAGDLQTAMNNAMDITNKSNNYDEFKTTMLNLIVYNENVNDIYNGYEHSFDIDDVYADTDAYNIYKLLLECSLTNALEYYFQRGFNERFSKFTNYWSKDKISEVTYIYTKNKYFGIIRWPLFDYDFNETQSKAARDAFVEFLMNRISNE